MNNGIFDENVWRILIENIDDEKVLAHLSKVSKMLYIITSPNIPWYFWRKGEVMVVEYLRL